MKTTENINWLLVALNAIAGLHKIRHGDSDVEVSVPQVEK